MLPQWYLYKCHMIRKWSETWLGWSVEAILFKLCSRVLNVQSNRLHSDSSLDPHSQWRTYYTHTQIAVSPTPLTLLLHVASSSSLMVSSYFGNGPSIHHTDEKKHVTHVILRLISFTCLTGIAPSPSLF